MKKLWLATGTMLLAVVAACVTVNIYFPEAAAEQAADRIIEKVRGEPVPDSGAYRHASPGGGDTLYAFAREVGSFLIADAEAQAAPDFDKPSPEKTALENSLKERFPRLEPYFDSGAIGLTERGTIELRDRNLVPLRERNTVLQLVTAQNNDWNALYEEIARLNGHPEWVDNIRRTFASRWVAKADPGWWYQQDGSWKQKQ